MSEHNHELPPVRVAFILDNVVVDILNTDERLGAIFLSNPTVVEVTNYEDMSSVRVGSEYNPETNEFTYVVVDTDEPMKYYSLEDMPESDSPERSSEWLFDNRNQ
jgi:hypothetical protein